MHMKRSLTEHLHEAFDKPEPVNEMLLAGLLAASLISYAMTPLLNSEFGKAVGGGIGNAFTGLGALLGSFKKNQDPKDLSKKIQDGDKGIMKSVGDMTQKILGMAKVSADENKDDKSSAAIQDLSKVLYKEDGTMKDIPLDEETQKQLKATVEKHKIKPMSKEEFDKTSQAAKDTVEKNPEIVKKAEEANNDVKKVVTDPDLKDLEPGTTATEKEIEIDGKKVKKKIFKGPRGGEYYFPDGAPKDAKHKVYVSK